MVLKGWGLEEAIGFRHQIFGFTRLGIFGRGRWMRGEDWRDRFSAPNRYFSTFGIGRVILTFGFRGQNLDFARFGLGLWVLDLGFENRAIGAGWPWAVTRPGLPQIRTCSH
jgi:hypothetical protein